MDTNTSPAFRPDYSVAKLALIGVAGFIIGCMLLFYDSMFRSHTSSFHEIGYNPKALAAQLVDSIKKPLQDSINKRDSSLRSGRSGDRIKDSVKNIADKEKVKALARIENYYNNAAPNYDTSAFKELNRVMHFKIGPNDIEKWDAGFDSICTHNFDSCIVGSAIYSFKDPVSKLEDSVGHSVQFRILKPASNIAFINKYPAVGIWLLFVVVFCSFCFMAIANCFALKNKAKAVFDDSGYRQAQNNRYGVVIILTLLCIGLMIAVWRLTFYDGHVVKDLFLMKHLLFSMNCVVVLGCIAGAGCLAGFIYTASMLSFFAAGLKSTTREIRTLTNLIAATTDAGTMADKTTEKAALEAQQSQMQHLFEKLSAVFGSYFIMAAIILSFTVFCTGALFNALNSLEFVQLLTANWGYSPFRNDFIYFYGALFTIMLLLVYVPARLQFDESNLWKPAALPTDAKWYDKFKGLFSSTKDLFVVASPLLASLVQSLFGLIFK